MIRKFVKQLLPKTGTHPDMTLPPMEGGEPPSVINDAKVSTNAMTSTSNKGVTKSIHPDFDLDFASLEQPVPEAVETDRGVIDPTELLLGPQRGEHATPKMPDGLAQTTKAPKERYSDVDLNFIQPKPQDVEAKDTYLSVFDIPLTSEQPQSKERTTADIADAVDFPDLNEQDRHADIDWGFELAWSSGEEWSEPSAEVGFETFDFDVADLEASAEEALPPSDTAIVKERRLDGVAADLVLSLGAFSSSDRRILFHRFRTVVEEFQHPASHAALHRLLAEGCSLEEIEEAAQLRCIWRDQPWLWAEKRVALSAWNVRRSRSQSLAFGWPTALRLVRTFGLVESERAMVEDWFDDWGSLSRAKSISHAEQMAFFTYAGYLRQLTPAIVLENSEGVPEEAADSQVLLELRASRGALIWKFENKLPPREGELSLDPARIRNHRNFEETASDSHLGLTGLTALAAPEATKTGFRRRYRFPEQTFDGGCGARAQVSSLHCHGVATIVGLDQKAKHITLAVPHDHKRLLEVQIALITGPPSSPPSLEEEENSDKRNGKKKKKAKKK